MQPEEAQFQGPERMLRLAATKPMADAIACRRNRVWLEIGVMKSRLLLLRLQCCETVSQRRVC